MAAATIDGAPVGRSALHGVGESVVAALDQLEADGALADGKATMVSLGAVAERLGPRWSARRDLVREHLERNLSRSMGPLGVYQRVSDTDYLIVQPEKSPLAGQMTSLNCLRNTLLHFLGETLIEDTLIHTVTRVGREGVYGERLDVTAVDAAAKREEADWGDDGGEAGAKVPWSPFVASNGKRVRVSCVLEPVFQLKSSKRIGYRVARRVLALPTDAPLTPDDVRRLSSSDIERIDFATIERGLGRLKAEGDAKADLSLILPVSFITLSTGRGRAELVNLLKSAQESVRLGLICEVCDIEGVPAGALLAAVSLIRPFSLYVFGQLSDPVTSSTSVLKGAGLHGLSLECPHSITGDAEFIGWAKGASAAARRVGKSAILYRLPSFRHAAVAALMGVTHASLRAAS
jgi:hypothetical protein